MTRKSTTTLDCFDNTYVSWRKETETVTTVIYWKRLMTLYSQFDFMYFCYLYRFQNASYLVNADCTTMYNCTNGLISVNDKYHCSSNAVCENRNDVRKCYCKSGYHGNGEVCGDIMTNCLDIFNVGYTANGIYTIKPSNWRGQSFEVFCNMTDGGGWTVSLALQDRKAFFFKFLHPYLSSTNILINRG